MADAMNEPANGWNAASSAQYRQLSAIAVPAREEQLATLLLLLPFGKHDPFRVVELASGEGALSHAILDLFPSATVLALDGELSMRTASAARLAPFGERAEVAAFDMPNPDWYPKLERADVVVSSLCIHHLNAAQKQDLFKTVGSQLSPVGCLLIADLILPQREEARALFAASWDQSARQRSIERVGSLALFEQFAQAEWNYYKYPDPFDQPSSLSDQLGWLRDAGFESVDCFWMQAGHAIYGGYRQRHTPTGQERVSYAAALEVARRVLG